MDADRLSAPGAPNDLGALYIEQLGYFDHQATKDRGRYVFLKLTEIAIAAAIPVVSLAWRSGLPAAILGALIALIEGMLNLLKLPERWVAYRKAAEQLRIEGLMWRTKSGRYANLDDPDQEFGRQLASILQQERSEWVALFGRTGHEPPQHQPEG